jgi:hypothetical protein
MFLKTAGTAIKPKFLNSKFNRKCILNGRFKILYKVPIDKNVKAVK